VDQGVFQKEIIVSWNQRRQPLHIKTTNLWIHRITTDLTFM